MTLTTDEILKYSVTITIDDRRYDAFKSRWEKYGLKAPMKFRGYTLRIGTYKELKDTKIDNASTNCCFSHAAAIRMAQTLGWPYIFITEDDALPCNSILSKLPVILSDIPDDTDILKLGVMQYTGNELARKGNLIARNAWGGHAYIVFRKYFDTYDHIFNNVNMICDKYLINYDPLVHNGNCRIWTSEQNLFAQKNPIEDYAPMHEEWSKTCRQEKLPNGDDFDW